MGRKGAEPSAVIPARHSNTPAMGPARALFAKFLLPGNVGMGNHLPGVCVLWCGHGRDAPGKESLCWWQGKGSARGCPGLSPPRAALEPGLVPHWVLKASFQAGAYQGGSKTSVGLVKRHIWAGMALWGRQLDVPSHPQGQHGWGQKWQWGDPAMPALLSQPTAGMEQ